MPENPPQNCLLCGSPHLVVTQHLSWEELRVAWSVVGVKLTPAALPHQDRSSGLDLFECAACGYAFCDTELAGNGQFYQELQAQLPNYYPVNPPEHQLGVEFARNHSVSTILDVGCGAGAFLNHAKSAGIETWGVELNPVAAEVCRSNGHQIHGMLLSELLQRKDSPRYPMVTSWQVMEHVPDPVGFFRDLVAVTQPGGYIAVAVPNERGLHLLAPLNPHVWPPHHVTRWRMSDLKKLGRDNQLNLVDWGSDTAYGSLIEHIWGLQIDVATRLGRPLPFGGDGLRKSACLAYRKLGLRHFMRGIGSSIYAFYQKPG